MKLWMVLLLLVGIMPGKTKDPLPEANRPTVEDRKFSSKVIEEVITEVKTALDDPVLALMFEQNFPNTLDTTVSFFGQNATTGRPDAFVITGDISAMWQRDSTNQVLPYLQFMGKDEKLKNLILGLINRQIHNVLIDGYANAYNFKDSRSPWSSDNSTKLDAQGNRINAHNPMLWERKFEIDSLAAVLKLQAEYYNQTKGDDSFMHEDYFKSLEIILTILTEQQLGTLEEDAKGRVPYTFQRNTHESIDTLVNGRSAVSKGTNGMVKSGFRPSDDACVYPYFVPGNAMLVVNLKRTSEMIHDKSPDLSAKFLNLSNQIRDDIYLRGTTKDANGNLIFAYEIDGLGKHLIMDDANIPSLMSLPYLGFINKTDEIYVNTRKAILDKTQNHYFFEGKDGQGIGGPHVGDQYIWPMSIITRAMTSDDDAEIITCLETLKKTTANTYFMHEAFLAKNSNVYTRSWFAWANSYFGELILDLLKRKPHLLTKKRQETDTTVSKKFLGKRKDGTI